MDLLNKFTHCYNDIVDFEEVHASSGAEDNVHALNILRIELDYLWTQLKRSYEDCRDFKGTENDPPADLTKLRNSYKNALIVYKRGLSSINSEIEVLTPPKTPVEKTERPTLNSNFSFPENRPHRTIKLPPCDTDTFYGSYKTWPTFRDLFSALYVENTTLSKVEKLCHLNHKTAGEAREIISHIPLTHDGFDLAWKCLVDRYENRRMQVNEQLKLLFNLPSVIIDSGASLKVLQRTVEGCMQTLKTLNINTESWDPILIFLCSTEVPSTYLEDFENTLQDSSITPWWKDFDSFLTQRFKILESVGNIKESYSKTPKSKHESGKPTQKHINTFHANTNSPPNNFVQKFNPQFSNNNRSNLDSSCQLCKQNHLLRLCPQFLTKIVNDRIHVVKTTNSCYNCLSLKHGVKDCKSNFNCRICNQRHNTLLHKGNEAQSTLTAPKAYARPSTSAQAQTSTIQSTLNPQTPSLTSLTLQDQKIYPQPPRERETLLFTAIVQIECSGQRYDARAIIDPGSQSTFISEKLKNRLRLPSKQNLVHVTGLSPNIGETSTKSCLFNLCSKTDPNFKLEVWAPVLKNLPSNLPPENLDPTILDEVSKLQLADPHFNISRPVDMLIGLDLGPFIYSFEHPLRSIGSLLTQKTVFGWIVGGPVTRSNQKKSSISLCNAVALDKLLTQFWEVEETPKAVLRSEEDLFCEDNFRSTTQRNSSGRYIVTLPFKKDVEIGHSRNIAMAQYLRMEKMLSTKPDIKTQYDQVILEYLELGHMKKVSSLDVNKTPNYYLPHHAVIKPDRLTTKLRVVFNASCPTSNKRSLNDNLHPGPILQQDLVLQTLKWRFFKFVYNADITKMYRQILVDPTQTQYQRILFRKSPSEPIEDFEIKTVTFGINCAPFLAIRTLLQLADDVKTSLPLASETLTQNMYVDDVLGGGHTLQHAIKSRKELNQALESAGFSLMKWTSNDPKVIVDLPQNTLLSVDCLHLAENLGTKTLGIKWNISSDSFSFPQPSIDPKQSYTKREVLSIIARFFDPCGWLAPVIIVAKLIMQQIWLEKVDWDEGLTSLTCLHWEKFIKNCPEIQQIKVPRWIGFTPNSNVEIHGFCDSSEKAYAATLYIRIEDSNQIQTHLLTAKTRVAPIKKISLPRLELCGAVLLAKLASSILPNLKINNYDIYYWTDSTIVLAWLRKPPCSWNTFVGNRIAEIQEKTDINKWQHVDSRDNPADIASRGCSPADLETHDLWWKGPSWLKLSKQNWPKQHNMGETTIESKTVKAFVTTTFTDPLDRFSTLSRAYRVISYAFRLWRNTSISRNHLRINELEISSEELKFVKNRLIILTQKHYFADEYRNLSQKIRISPNSKILTLNPFIDSHGIIRANGRLAQSTALTYSERHPIILPHNSRLTRLLIEHTHKITLHGGNQLLTRIIRTEFWILRLRPLIKTIIHNCKICVLYKQHCQTQIMASLPAERTTISRPFTNTGVDFAGPFLIRNFTGRCCLITKGYVCIFVCFSTKAVHLEATTDLSTQSFLAAFSRFIGRRGCPSTIHSDNGTNFVGAADLLKKDRLEFMKTLQSSIENNYSHQNVNWKFIPPGAPHMGGLWEAGVKSFKTHLRKFVPNTKFTFEEFSTILTRIESCLNSRPLSPANDDPNDLSPLTPGHFLIGAPLLTPAEPDLNNENVTFANRWKRLKIIYHTFCQRWKSEYLQQLHRRYKWKHQTTNLKVNDLVILKETNLPPNEWKMCRIINVHPGPDKNNRVVDLKTSNGIIRRPIHKLIPLSSE